MLVTPMTAFAGTLKTDANLQGLEEGDLIKLDDFKEEIDEIFEDVCDEFPGSYKNLYSQVQTALSNVAINQDGMFDYEEFKEELNSQPAGFGRNVIKAYTGVCIYAVANSYVILRDPSDPQYRWQYEYVYKSDSYAIKIYTPGNFDVIEGQIPRPKGNPALYGKRVYVQGWPGNHLPAGSTNGLCGIGGKVLAIGSLTEPNCVNKPVNNLFERLGQQFPILTRLLQLPAFNKLLN